MKSTNGKPKLSEQKHSAQNMQEERSLVDLIRLQAAKLERLGQIKEEIIFAVAQGDKSKDNGHKSLDTIDFLEKKALTELCQYIRKNSSLYAAIKEREKKFRKFQDLNGLPSPDLGADIGSLRALSISQIPIFLLEKYEMKIFDDESFKDKVSQLTVQYKTSLEKKYSDLLSKGTSSIKSSLELLIKTIDEFNIKIGSLENPQEKSNNVVLKESNKELYDLLKLMLEGIAKHNRDSYGKNIENLYEEQRSKFFSTTKDSDGIESFVNKEFELEIDETAQYLKEIKMPYLFKDLVTTLGIIKEDHLQDVKQTDQVFIGSSLEKVLNWLFENPYFLCLYINKKLSKLNNIHLKQKPMLSNDLETRMDMILSVNISVNKKDKNGSEKLKPKVYYDWIFSKLNKDFKNSEYNCDYISSTLECLKSNEGNSKITQILKVLYNYKDDSRVPKTLEYLSSHQVALYIGNLNYRPGYPIAFVVKIKSPIRAAEKLARRYIKHLDALSDISFPNKGSELYSNEDKRKWDYLILNDLMGVMFVYPPTSQDLTYDDKAIKYLSLSRLLDSNKKLKKGIGRNFYKDPKGGFISGIKGCYRPKINNYIYYMGQVDFIEIMFTDLLGLIDSEIGSRAHNLYEDKESRFIDSLKGINLNTYNYLLKISERLLSPYWNEITNNPQSNFFFPKA